jgi:secreted trypsin-like serine protease
VSLIVGGTKVLKGELPHMASLGWHGLDGAISWKCGASIISERWLLSAAHCRRSEGQEPSLVRMGIRRLDDPSHYDSKIVELVSPPDYSIRTYYNDLLLVRVQDEIM